MTDPISDMLTRIRNAVSARHARVEMPTSKLKAELARILQAEGYIQGFQIIEKPGLKKNSQLQQLMQIFLKYGPRGQRVITGIQRISRPGKRVYFGVDEVPLVLGGLGTNILTTSRGVMTGRKAKQNRVGGEVLCNVW